jgi:hypothetical protein
MPLENLNCEQCGVPYYGDPYEVRLCLACDEEPEERNVSVFTIDTVTDHDFRPFATLQAALTAASYCGLADVDFCIDEEDAISHHKYDVHYRNEQHREAYRRAMEETARAYREGK